MAADWIQSPGLRCAKRRSLFEDCGPSGLVAGRNGDRLMDSEAPQLCSRKNPIVPTSSSAKRSISASVVVKPRLARAVPERP